MSNGESPQDSYHHEIVNALMGDPQRLGDVFRERDENGDYDVQRIANKLGLGTINPVYSTMGSIQTLLECRRLTDGPISARQRASMLRSFARRHAKALSSDTRQRLDELATEHDRIAVDEEAIVRENEGLEQRSGSKVPNGLAGIYVFTYPHYLRYPVVPTDEDDTNPRTYLKIGSSGTDMAARVKQQNTTAIPEPPIILRMFTCPDGGAESVERKIHNHLSAADHNPNRSTGAGKEWFLTHLRFVDSTAELLGLKLEFSHPDY